MGNPETKAAGSTSEPVKVVKHPIAVATGTFVGKSIVAFCYVTLGALLVKWFLFLVKL